MDITSHNWRKRKSADEPINTIRKIAFLHTVSTSSELICHSVVTPILLSFPNEVLLHIICFLDVYSILSFCSSCSRIFYLLHTTFIWRNVAINRQCFDFLFLNRWIRSDVFFSISSNITVFRLSGKKLVSKSNILYGILKFEPFLHCLSKLHNLVSLTMDSYRLEFQDKYSDLIFPKIRNLHFSNVHFELFFFRSFHLNHSFPSLNNLSFSNCPKFCYSIIPYISRIPYSTNIYINSCYRIDLSGLHNVISTLYDFRTQCNWYLDGEII